MTPRLLTGGACIEESLARPACAADEPNKALDSAAPAATEQDIYGMPSR